jgi:hypothetical protein
MRATRLLVVFLSMICLSAAQKSTEYVDVYLRPFPGPQVYKDPRSGVLLYVETDGRHVAAISRDGKLLWNRDPFTDAHLSFYRTEKPQVVYIGPVKKSAQIDGGKPDEFVGIRFNSSQFGLLRISSGEFQFLGQD